MEKRRNYPKFEVYQPGQSVKHKIWGGGKILARWEEEGRTYLETRFKEGKKISCLDQDHAYFKLQSVRNR